ncbi:unnamed protein product [Diabrotica balteata]|uniref:Uncharacterized protein n=1 Tax=Diabrotica balteata TaxID=107213 RepID=A0A9N9SU98_DIABA|nr:unnamed protein product [Diabrotica balteata]
MESQLLDFSVVKQKIIKTDELLNKYIEINCKLKKNVQTSKELKSQLERSQLEQERSEYSQKTLQSKYNDLESKYNEVMDQMVNLQKKYGEKLISSQTTIQDMQVELALLKELSHNSSNADITIQELTKKIEEHEETEEQISKDNLRLKKDILSLQQQISRNKEEYDKNIQVLQREKDEISSSLYHTQSEQKEQLKKHAEICHFKDMRINQLEYQVSDVTALKDLVKLLTFEKEQLKQESISKYIPKSVVSVGLQTDQISEPFFSNNLEFGESDMFLCDIFKEMINYTTLLSPLRSNSPEIEYCLDNIENASHISANVSMEEIKENNSLVLKGNDDIHLNNSTYENGIAVSHNIEDDEDYMIVDSGISSFCTPITPLSDISKDYFSNKSDVNSFEDFKIKNKQRFKKARYLKQRRKTISKMTHFLRRKKKLVNRDPVLRALKVLKQSNINFIISNEEIFSSVHNKSIKKVCQQLKITTRNVEYLTCAQVGCRQSCMLVEDGSLLGFFESNKNTTHCNEKISIESKQHNSITDLTNTLLPNCSPDVVLDKLAELVSEKLKKNKTHWPSMECNSEYLSESEAELRSLFSNSVLDTNGVIESDINIIDLKLSNEELIPRNISAEITSSTDAPLVENNRSISYSVSSDNGVNTCLPIQTESANFINKHMVDYNCEKIIDTTEAPICEYNAKEPKTTDITKMSIQDLSDQRNENDDKIATVETFLELDVQTNKETDIKSVSVKESCVNKPQNPTIIETKVCQSFTTENNDSLDMNKLSEIALEEEIGLNDGVNGITCTVNFNNATNDTTKNTLLNVYTQDHQDIIEGAYLSKEPPDKLKSEQIDAVDLVEKSKNIVSIKNASYNEEKALDLVINEPKVKLLETSVLPSGIDSGCLSKEPSAKLQSQKIITVDLVEKSKSISTKNDSDNQEKALDLVINEPKIQILETYVLPSAIDSNDNDQICCNPVKDDFSKKYSPKIYSDELDNHFQLPLPTDEEYNVELSHVPREASNCIDLSDDEGQDRCLIQNLRDFNHKLDLNLSFSFEENEERDENETTITISRTPSPKIDNNSVYMMSPSNILDIYRIAPACISPLSPNSALKDEVDEEEIKNETDQVKNIDLNNESISSKQRSPLKKCIEILSNTGESIMSDSTISPTSKCINYVLQHEQMLGSEIDSFLQQFESDKSFSDLNNSTNVVENPCNQGFTKSPPNRKRTSQFRSPTNCSAPVPPPQTKSIKNLTKYFESANLERSLVSQQPPNKNLTQITSDSTTSVHIPAGLAILATKCNPAVSTKPFINVCPSNNQYVSAAASCVRDSSSLETEMPMCSPLPLTARKCELFCNPSGSISPPIPKVTYGLSSPVSSPVSPVVNCPESPDQVELLQHETVYPKIIPLEKIDGLINGMKNETPNNDSKCSEGDVKNNQPCIRSKYGRVIKVKKYPDYYDGTCDNLGKSTKISSVAESEEKNRHELEAKNESESNEKMLVNKIDETSCSEQVNQVPDPAKKPKLAKKLTKLQSSVKRQMKQTQVMFRQPATNICDNNLEISNQPEEMETEISNKKIKIVQNVLIPSNASSPIDLLQSKSSVSDHDSNRLKPEPFAPQQSNCDVLSSIISQMDKIRSHKTVIMSKRVSTPKSINEKEWRRGLLDIAETIYNRDINMPNIYGTRSFKKLGLLKRGAKVSDKIGFLLKKFLGLPSDETLPENIIVEFARLNVDYIIDIIIYQLSRDKDKPEDCYPAPLMTPTQRKFLRLLIQLEQKRMNIIERFYCRIQYYVCRNDISVKVGIPLTRLFMGLCRLRADINMMRTFCCEAFYYAGEVAIPIFFTVLTSWADVIPLYSEVDVYPMAKVLVQLVYVMKGKKPECNSYALRDLLDKYYGYPKERRDCDEFFQEIYQHYLEKPCESTEYAIRMYLKHKDKPWTYKKLNELFKPLIYKIPPENSNFKAANIILVGKLLKYFNSGMEFDKKCLVEMKLWFEGLLEDNSADPIVLQSIHYSLNLAIPRRIRNPELDIKKPKKPKPIPRSQIASNL